MNNNSLNRRRRGSSNIGSNMMPNINSRGPRNNRIPGDKNSYTVEGIYNNARLMHSTTSLVGCTVHVETKEGKLYEGVLRTFSPEFDLVVDTVAKVEKSVATTNSGQGITALVSSLADKNRMDDTYIFNLKDIVMLSAISVDVEFATRTHFTDTEISKFDSSSLSKKKDLVPWEGPADDAGGIGDLEDDKSKSNQNGWNADDMFRMNEEKYKIISSYDNKLEGYTVPLIAQDTDEYKLKAAEAERIAKDIESDTNYKERIAKEDGDEEDKYSAVTRPENPVANTYGRQNMPNKDVRDIRRKPGPTVVTSSLANSNSGGKTRVANTSNASTYYKYQSSQGQHSNYSKTSPPSHSNQQKFQSNYEVTNKSVQQNVHANTSPPIVHSYTKCDQEDGNQSQHQAIHSYPQRSHADNRRVKRKDEVADLKKFSDDLKISHDKETSNSKDTSIRDDSQNKIETYREKTESPVSTTKECDEVNSSTSSSNERPAVLSPTTPTQPSQQDSLVDESESEKLAKKSTLNPNAKEFNPTVKAFTPRTQVPTPPVTGNSNHGNISVGYSHTNHNAAVNQHMHHQHSHHQQHHHPSQPINQSQGMQQQNRLQSQVVFPSQFAVPAGLQFVTPNSYLVAQNMPVAQSFQTNNNANSNQPPPRFRKGNPPYVQQNRNEYNQSSAPHVAAATGHPVLASGPIQAQQMSLPYQTQQAPGVVSTSGPPQQMYSHMYQLVNPRVNMVTNQVGMLPHVQYDPSLHPIYMTNMGPVQIQPTIVAQPIQQQQNVGGGNGPHSNASTPQSVTPNTTIHGGAPTPTPVHHQGHPTQPPTPTPTSAAVMYGGMTHQQSAAAIQHANNAAQYGQQVLILQSGQGLGPNQHQVSGPGSIHPGLSHNSGHHGGHHGPQSNQSHVMPVTLPVIPTSAPLVQHFQANPQSRI